MPWCCVTSDKINGGSPPVAPTNPVTVAHDTNKKKRREGKRHRWQIRKVLTAVLWQIEGPADPQQAPILPLLCFPATVSVSCKSHRLVYIISILSLRPGIWLFDWLPSWIILLESDLQYPNKMLSRWNFSSAKQSKTHFLSNAFFHTIYLPTSLPVSPVGKKEESFFIFGQPWSCDPLCPSLGCISLPKRRRRCRCGPDGQPQRITVNPSCRLDPAAAPKNTVLHL